MVETAEGIGGRKWSLQRDPDGLCVMEGNQYIAEMQTNDKTVMQLVVTAPELWEAANDLLFALKAAPGGMVVTEAQQIAAQRLRDVVAKSVGKTRWEDVAQ